MTSLDPTDPKRKRAPSQRSLATRKRVLDAAEEVFSRHGFDGSTIRDIAEAAGEPVGSVHHHGGGKEALFRQVVARRADPLSRARLSALARAKDSGGLGLDSLIGAFMRPLFDFCQADPRWRDYARLVAYVSADDRWREISADHFDPVAEVFVAEIVALVPGMDRRAAAEGFVFCVSSMLALLTSGARIGDLGGGAAPEEAQIGHLIRFCAAGLAGG